MTSSNNEVMEDVIPSEYHGPKTILIDPPTNIYARIADNFVRVNDMLNGEKEYGNPRVMFQNISKRWFGCDDAEVDVAIMMAELKIERIKYDRRLVSGRHRLSLHGIGVHAGGRRE